MKKDLKFIHITKTGGTSIEDIGKSKNIFWGRFHDEYKENSLSDEWWHEFLSKKSYSFKVKYDWFTIVRNPYSRIISEFYCPWIKNIYRNTHSRSVFNKSIRYFINQRLETGGHWSEQNKYIDSSCNTHILKFEELPYNFDKLMKTYGIDLKLNIFLNQSPYKKNFSTIDLDKETLTLINDIYDKDFILFNYVRI